MKPASRMVCWISNLPSHGP